MAKKPTVGDSVRFVRGFEKVPAETVARIAAVSDKFFAIQLMTGETVLRVPRDVLELATESN